ncbi:MAG: hypothetical protein V4489_10470 [Chlamydiota bacterium]
MPSDPIGSKKPLANSNDHTFWINPTAYDYKITLISRQIISSLGLAFIVIPAGIAKAVKELTRTFSTQKTPQTTTCDKVLKYTQSFYQNSAVKTIAYATSVVAHLIINNLGLAFIAIPAGIVKVVKELSKTPLEQSFQKTTCNKVLELAQSFYQNSGITTTAYATAVVALPIIYGIGLTFMAIPAVIATVANEVLGGTAIANRILEHTQSFYKNSGAEAIASVATSVARPIIYGIGLVFIAIPAAFVKGVKKLTGATPSKEILENTKFLYEESGAKAIYKIISEVTETVALPIIYGLGLAFIAIPAGISKVVTLALAISKNPKIDFCDRILENTQSLYKNLTQRTTLLAQRFGLTIELLLISPFALLAKVAKKAVQLYEKNKESEVENCKKIIAYTNELFELLKRKDNIIETALKQTPSSTSNESNPEYNSEVDEEDSDRQSTASTASSRSSSSYLKEISLDDKPALKEVSETQLNAIELQYPETLSYLKNDLRIELDFEMTTDLINAFKNTYHHNQPVTTNSLYKDKTIEDNNLSLHEITLDGHTFQFSTLLEDFLKDAQIIAGDNPVTRDHFIQAIENSN